MIACVVGEAVRGALVDDLLSIAKFALVLANSSLVGCSVGDGETWRSVVLGVRWVGNGVVNSWCVV